MDSREVKSIKPISFKQLFPCEFVSMWRNVNYVRIAL